MTTGKCYDCGKDRMFGAVRCADCHAQWLQDYMSFTQPEERKLLVHCKECNSMVQRRCFEGPYGEYSGMPLYSCGKIAPNTIQFINGSKIQLIGEDDNGHWTFPEDENPKPQAGWKWINLNWLFRGWGEELVERHDKMTTSTDFSITKAKIPVWRKAQWWKEAAYELTMKKPKAGFQKMVARFSSTFMKLFHKYWDEGPLK